MDGLINRRIMTISTLWLLIAAATTHADQIFNVTDLGSSYNFTKDATGYTTAVTSGDGSNSYVFDKYPVNYIYTSTSSQNLNWTDTPHVLIEDDRRMDNIAMSNKYGSIQITSERFGGIAGEVTEYFPGKSLPEWYIDSSDVQDTHVPKLYTYSSMASPVNDFNIHGQVVGTIDYTDAVSSDNGFLNNAIASQLGIHLLNALYIDDHGDIIASGEPQSDYDKLITGDMKYYLLTPGGLPTPAPEPTTLAVLAVGLMVAAVRSAHRRRVGDSRSAL